MGGTSGRSVVAAIALSLLAAACSESDDRSTSSPATAAPDSVVVRETLPAPSTLPTLPTPPTTEPRLPSPASAAIVRQERRYNVPEPIGPLAEIHGVVPALLPPGRHTTDVLGIEMTVELTDWVQLNVERIGTVQMTRTDTPIGLPLPTILFERPIGLAEPRRVADGNLLPGEYPVPPDELGAWLDEVEQIEVIETGEAVAGDRTGRWYEVALDPAAGTTIGDCAPGRCVSTWWSGGSITIVARENEAIRYYEFPDPQGPIFVLVAAPPDDDGAWFEFADQLIRNTRFGPSAPHPTPDGVSVGLERIHERGDRWRFISFPGIVIDGAATSVSRQRPGYLGYEPWTAASNRADSTIVRPLQDAAGVAMTGIDDVIAALEASNLDRLDDQVLFDTTAVVFAGTPDGPIFRRAEVEPGDLPDFVYWPDWPVVQVWAFDSPIGPLLIAAETNDSDNLDVGIAHVERLVDLMSFDCSDGACVESASDR